MTTKDDKVEHVRKAKQTRNHKCHWPGCAREVKPAMWGCLEHWRKIPMHFRDRIWETYTIKQEVNMTPSDEYIATAKDIQAWIYENYGVAEQ